MTTNSVKMLDTKKEKPIIASIIVYTIIWTIPLFELTLESVLGATIITIYISLITLINVNLARKKGRNVNWAFFWGAVAWLPSAIIYNLMSEKKEEK